MQTMTMTMSKTVSDYRQLSTDYQVIERAILFLDAHYQEQPSLAELAASVGLSEYHFQRLFTHWAGISPKRFLQFLTKEHAKHVLDESYSLLDASYEAGLSGPGRLHDLFVNCEAVTPGEYKQRGAGLRIAYGFHPSPFGECLLAVTERGICSLAFVVNAGHQSLLDDLHHRWRQAELYQDEGYTAPLLEQVFDAYTGGQRPSLNLHLNGTNFQIKVWEALLRVPPGQLISYQGLAQRIGMPRAARAVSQAVADNPVAVLIPCHRVIRKLGVVGGYRWGVARKQALLGWEMARGAA